ncbi:TPA: oligosaccharide flippase family protein [Proteus mirabilis]|uniref:oligosaccharide flippase family protein n=2 Tax=Proteus mirabilis TaxID=584 RepID=UPI0013DEE2FE|nr:oligosaccharide flippase family protein [Proteus mirabilis]EKW7427493.1 oligosaccharide flippase family protein [Proteus mirabilis]ELB1231545.1 oligosaccharide flippase family protein [Proteus mirabilis]MCL8580743.1 oligosaccharide flippase family protein [Proteus mirabilis]MCL8591909.1 oligosaccharide flippase family protein [Proteus mirabilis]MCL8605945.1 oligosaccharide flippase family protein [Proteus mirabilis]
MNLNERKLGVALTYLNIFLNTFVMLAYTPFVLRYLGQSEYGLYSLAITILTYLAILDFGFGNAIIVFTSNYLEKNERKQQQILYGTIKLSYIIISIASLIIMLLLYQNIEPIFSDAMTKNEIDILKVLLIILAINISLMIPLNIYRSILTAYEKFIFIKALSIFRSLSIPLLIIVAIYFNYRVVVMIFIVSIINIIFILLHYFYYKKIIDIKFSVYYFDFKVFRMVFKYSVFIFLALIVDQINWNFGQLIIGSYNGTESVAIYSISILFNTTFIMLSTAISGVMLPKISKMISKGITNSELTLEMIKIGRLQSFIIFMVVLGFILFGKEFIYYWAGHAYQDAYYLTIIIMIPLSIPLIQNLGLSILQAKNKFAFRSIAATIMAIITIFLSLILIRNYGYWGVAFSISVALFLLNGVIMNIYYFKLGLNIKKFWIEIIKIFIPMTILFFIIYIIKAQFNVISIKLLILFIFSSVAFIFLFSYSFIMNSYERNIVSQLVVYAKKVIIKNKK